MKHSPEDLEAWAKQALAWRDSMDTRWLQLIMALLLRGYSESQATNYLQMLAEGRRP